MNYDVIIVGGGSAGCVLAARLSEDPARSVLLIEAGPDFAAVDVLPPEIADGWTVAGTHDWGYATAPDATGRTIALLRGRLMGGCSALNATLALRGSPADFDGWAAAGNTGWSFEEVLPFFVGLEHDLDFGDDARHGTDGPLPVRRYRDSELSAWSRAVETTAAALGHPGIPDLNQPGAVGVGHAPLNTVDGLRMSTAITYLAVARTRSNLTILPDTLVDRVLTAGTRAWGVRTETDDISGALVILAAGTYSSPAILLRSGIGPAEDLTECGIPVVADLPGVGQHLVDHPAASLDLPIRTDTQPGPKFQVCITCTSTLASNSTTPDLQLLASGPWPGGPTDAIGSLFFSVLEPRSHGSVRLRNADPEATPRIEPRYLEHPDDLSRLVEGLRTARRIARAAPLADLVAADELAPAPRVPDDDTEALKTALRAVVTTYHHPVGTCCMGPNPERGAVVDARGHVYGIDALRVADASIMPTIPSANTNLATMMIAERIAAWLRER